MTKRTNALWFFVALLGGGTAIWWAKIAIENAWFAAMVAASVVLALMTYYLLNDEDAPEEEGDNVYYLGLLFTLISLMFTLVELFGAGGIVVHSQKIPVLLENFGIALTSTVVGIAGRVALQNWQRATPSESPEFAEGMAVLPPSANIQDLEKFNRHHLGRIARDLEQGANALARFHRIVRSYATDSEKYLHSHSEMLKQESAEFKDTLEHNANTFAKELKGQAESTLRAVGDSLNAVTQQAKALLEQLESVHDGYLENVRKTTQSFHDDIQSVSSQSLETLRKNFDAAAKQSLSLVQNLSAIDERIEKAFDNLASGLTLASDTSVAFGNSANQAAKSTKVLEGEIEKLRAGLAPLQAGTEAIASILDALNKLDARIRVGRDTEQTATAVRQIGKILQTITAEAATATKHAAEAATLLDALTRSIQTTEGEIQHMTEALRTLASEAEAQTNNLHQHRGSGLKFWNRS